MDISFTTTVAILGLALLSGITTVIGVALAYLLKNRRKWTSFGIGFSVGIMLLISFLELFPEALKAVSVTKVSVFVLCGMIFIALLNYLIPHKHLTEEEGAVSSHLHRVAFLVAAGLILHDFPEGFALTNSFLVSPTFGIFIAISIALHNIPEEYAMAVPFIMAGKKMKFLIKLALISALAEPAGAILGLLTANISSSANHLSLAFAGGAMIYVAIHELLPLVKIYKHAYQFVIGMIGSAIVYLGLLSFFPE